MFRFSIRDLMWLMVVVACLLGWWRDRSEQDREISQSNYASRQLIHVLKSDGWYIQGGIGGLTVEKGEQSVELVGFPVKPLLLPIATGPPGSGLIRPGDTTPHVARPDTLPVQIVE